jgi:hypothetical protein
MLEGIRVSHRRTPERVRSSPTPVAYTYVTLRYRRHICGLRPTMWLVTTLYHYFLRRTPFSDLERFVGLSKLSSLMA